MCHPIIPHHRDLDASIRGRLPDVSPHAADLAYTAPFAQPSIRATEGTGGDIRSNQHPAFLRVGEAGAGDLSLRLAA